MTLKECRDLLTVLANARPDIETLPVLVDYKTIDAAGIRVWARTYLVSAEIQESQHDARQLMIVLTAGETPSDLT